MLYEEIMFDSSTLIRYRIFRYLMQISRESYAISQLAEDMNLNYQQAVIDLTEIDEELLELNPQHKSILLGAGKVNCFNLSSTVDEYRYYLLKKSVPFQFIIYFLNEEHPNVVDFCDTYSVSRSTVSRKMEKLKAYLKQYNLRLTYTEANLVGDERLVRVMLFNLIWLGTRGIEIPFNTDLDRVEELVDGVSEFFPLSLSYFGQMEIRYFAALYLARIQKGNFVKYDKRYDFLMKKNSYYDFDQIDALSEDLNIKMTPKQRKAETSFVFFLAHYVPFYTMENEATLQQTIYDFSTRPNPIYSLNQEFLNFIKEDLFKNQPNVLDSPLVIGNLLNIGFTFYVTEQPIPNIQTLVVPAKEQEHAEYLLEQKIDEFFTHAEDKDQYAFVKKVKPYMVKSYKNILLPYYNSLEFSHKIKIGLAMEHNFVLVKWVYQFLDDLRFVETETYQSGNRYDYDLILSSSLLLKQKHPQLPVYFWDHSGGEDQLMQLYQYLRRIYNEKNLQIHFENAEASKD
ncbi:helix-turn-helix domain-containing protein [Enterococcus sp. HY326]|uniref:helix-turn-helix domain-containing protein n=1 Tax=Enterococcus sp. HY326 TaxID=2971265 RepID=UPI002240B34F|nr:helix-turn-helix domain-containing protein [Enterococcus sp. HY326]